MIFSFVLKCRKHDIKTINSKINSDTCATSDTLKYTLVYDMRITPYPRYWRSLKIMIVCIHSVVEITALIAFIAIYLMQLSIWPHSSWSTEKEKHSILYNWRANTRIFRMNNFIGYQIKLKIRRWKKEIKRYQGAIDDPIYKCIHQRRIKEKCARQEYIEERCFRCYF